jgi:hypothetical protein
VHHGDTQAAGRRDVDGVQTHPVPADHLEVLAGRHQTGRARGLEPKEDARAVGRGLDHAGLGLFVAHDDAGFALEQRETIGIDLAGDHDERTAFSGHRALLSVSYFQATRTSRGASSENGVPSRPP